jgi:hypothetical protein
MKENYATIPITDIYLDESIYPRENIDHKRIKMFVENLRDDFKFDAKMVAYMQDKRILATRGRYVMMSQ